MDKFVDATKEGVYILPNIILDTFLYSSDPVPLNTKDAEELMIALMYGKEIRIIGTLFSSAICLSSFPDFSSGLAVNLIFIYQTNLLIIEYNASDENNIYLRRNSIKELQFGETSNFNIMTQNNVVEHKTGGGTANLPIRRIACFGRSEERRAA